MKDEIERVLGIAEDWEFLEELSALDTKHNGIDFHERPGMLGMIGGLNVLHQCAVNEGIWKFLAETQGASFHECRDWCHEIGATRATAYLDAVARLYPGGTVPRDETARYEVVENAEHDAPMGESDAFRKLDKEYADAMPELATRLRSYVRSHAERLARELDVPGPANALDEAGLIDETERSLQKMEAAFERMQHGDAATRLLAESRGLRKLGGKADPAFVAIVEAAMKLSVDDWMTIVERVGSNMRAFRKAEEEASSVPVDMFAGRLGTKEEYKKLQEPHLAAREPLLAHLTQLLPEHAMILGKQDAPFRAYAQRTVIEASIVFIGLDYLLVTTEGQTAAKTLLSYFDGFAPIPPELRLPQKPVKPRKASRKKR